MADRRVADPGRSVPVVPLGLATVALVMGLLLYLTDRPPGHAVLIPAAWSLSGPPGAFGAAGAWLPSLLHAFAFTLLTAATRPCTAADAFTSGALWCAIGLGFEILQHPAIAGPLAAALEGVPGLHVLGRFASQGRFDPADLAALLAGAAAATGLLILLLPRENRHDI